MADIDTIDAPPGGSLEIRSAQLTGVRWADRIIELLVMPYNREAVVPEGGGMSNRMIREVCMPGAFAGLERRANRIRVNRDHDVRRTIGKAVTFHTNATDGLIGEFRIANTPLGDETLELADEGVLDASAGFNLKPDGATWHERRTLRKLHKVWLVHVAMTPDPAYEDARVLAVRAADTTAAVTPAAAVVPTPHLAELYARELAERAAAIDARYSAR